VYPREIEAGLESEYRRDIAEWFDGVMTSRKLLTLTDGMTEDSWFKIAVRRDLKRLQEEAEAEEIRAVQDRITSQLFRKKKAVSS